MAIFPEATRSHASCSVEFTGEQVMVDSPEVPCWLWDSVPPHTRDGSTGSFVVG
jgi:hypothetical protein